MLELTAQRVDGYTSHPAALLQWCQVDCTSCAMLACCDLQLHAGGVPEDMAIEAPPMVADAARCCFWQPVGRRVLMMSKKPKKTDDNGWTPADDSQLYKWKGAICCCVSEQHSLQSCVLRNSQESHIVRNGKTATICSCLAWTKAVVGMHSGGCNASLRPIAAQDFVPAAESCWKAMIYLSMATLAYAAGHTHECAVMHSR